MKKLSFLFSILILSLNIGCASGPPVFQFRPGVYTGEGQGFFGTIFVKVEVDTTQIISVSIGENRETPTIAAPAFNRIPAQIVERQSLVVDNVAGATITSNGIISGVKAALLSAGATEEQLMAAARR